MINIKWLNPGTCDVLLNAYYVCVYTGGLFSKSYIWHIRPVG